MRFFVAVLALVTVMTGGQVTSAQRKPYRTLNDTFEAPRFASPDE